MWFSKKRYVTVLLLLVWAAGYFYARSRVSHYPSYFVWDHLTRWSLQARSTETRERLKRNFPIVLITVDNESLEKLGLRWPWGREVIAMLLEELAPHKPRVTAIDLAFIGKSANAWSDTRLAEALKGLPKVVLGSFFNEKGRYQFPYKPILEAAGGHTGFVDVPADHDGVVRRVASVAVTEKGEVIAPSFSLAAVSLYEGYEGKITVEKQKGRLVNRYGAALTREDGAKRVFRTDSHFHIGTSYPLFPSDIPRIPFWRALVDDAALRKTEDKIVVIGVEAPVFQDVRLTPLGRVTGAALQVMNLFAFLSDGGIRALPPSLSFFAFLVWTFASAFFFVRLKRWKSLLFSAFLLAAAVLAGAYLFFYHRTFADLTLAVQGTALLAALFVLYEDGSKFIEIMRLKQQAAKDALTGVYTFRYFELLTDVTLRHGERNKKITLLIFDLDHFKEVNDRHGHQSGNEVLKYFASVLRKNSRQRDIVARFGGDEFCVVLQDRGKDVALKFLERVQRNVSENHPAATGVPKFTFSAGGVAAFRGQFHKTADFVKVADRALYECKTAGRNRYEVIEIFTG